MKIGRKLFYDKVTGNTIIDTGERQGSVVLTTVEQDITTYTALSERNRDTFDVLELEFGQYSEDFAQCNGYRVNPETKELEFSYPDPNVPVEEQVPVYRPPLSEQVKQLENKFLNADERYQQLDILTISLEELKQFKLEQLKYFCSSAIYEGFTSSINNYEFGFNEVDQANFTQQTLLIVAADGNYTSTISWKTKNVGVVDLTLTDFNAIVNEAATHKLAQQNKYWALEEEVRNATTPDEVDAIVW